MYRGGYYTFTSDYLKNFKLPSTPNPQLSEKVSNCLDKHKKLQNEKSGFMEWVESDWGVSVDDLSLKTHLREYWEYDFDEFMRVAKKNKSQIEGDVKSRTFRERMEDEWQKSMDKLRPLMREVEDLEREIDAIVFDLYDLTEEEVETVLNSLDTPEDDKDRILKEFQKLAN